MDTLFKPGRFFLAVAMVMFGIQQLVAASFSIAVPGHPWAVEQPLWSLLIGGMFVVAGIGTLTRSKARLAATVLAVLFLLRALIVYLPQLALHLHDPRTWTRTFELLAICSGCILLARTDRAAGPARLLFAAALSVFGIQHLMYAQFVADLIPSWIPGHLSWAYGTGVAFIAASLSIATKIKARLAASLTGLMFFLWVVLLHLPRVAGAHLNGNEWTNSLVALAMSGSALIVSSQSEAR
jgi:uncharacterized membrane protein